MYVLKQKFPKSKNRLLATALALFSLMAHREPLHAQDVGSFGFSGNAATYQSLTGATNIATATSASAVDDNVYNLPNGTIPFGFSINGNSYTGLNVYANGYVSFGSTSSSASTPISSYLAYDAVIAPLGADLLGLYNISGKTANIAYKISGTSPNRLFIIEWQHFSYYTSSAITAANHYDLNFQLELHENGLIRYNYDLNSTGNPAPASQNAQIGLRGASSAQYNNRASSTGLISTAQGSSASATVAAGSAALPVHGFSYVWTPPGPCAAPTAQAANLVLNNTGIIINGSFSAANPAADKYLILRTLAGQPHNPPVNGTSYAQGMQSTALNAFVVANANGTGLTFENNYNHGIRGNNKYVYTIYTYNANCTGGPVYNTVNPLVDSIINCPVTVNGIGAVTITANTATISWPLGENGTASPINTQIEVSTDNTFQAQVPGSPYTVSGGALSVNATSLQANTQYFVRGKNTGHCESAYSSVYSFYTACVPQTLIDEGFNAAANGSIPNCWAKIIAETGSGGAVTVSSGSGVSGTNGVSLSNGSNNTNNAANKIIFVSPQLNNLSAGTHRLRFKAKKGVSSSDAAIQVVTLNGNTAAAAVTNVGTVITPAGTAYEEFIVYFNGINASETHIGFRRMGAATYSIIYIDDIVWEPVPACPDLVSVSAQATSPTRADLSWTPGPVVPALGYEYFVGTANTPPASGAVLQTAAGTSVTVDNLNAGTTYYVWVRAKCTTTDVSPWKPATFTTYTAAPVPWLEPFATSAYPAGWNTSGWSLGTVRGATGNPGMNLYKNLFSTTASGQFTTVAVGTLPNDQYVFSFDYKQSGYSSPYAPLADWGYFKVFVSTDFGSTWTQIDSIGNTVSTGYENKSYALAAYTGQYVQFKLEATRTAGDYDLSFDNFKVDVANVVTVSALAVTTQNNVPAAITANGGTLQMVATVLPATASQDMSWSVVNGTGSATISANGLLTAQSNGTVWAKAVSVQDATKYDSLLVTISNQAVTVASVAVITQNNVPAAITANGGTLQMVATVLPATASQDVSWSVVNGTGFATISANGLLTAQSNGTVWAKAVSVQDATKYDSLLVTISGQAVTVTSVAVTTQNNVPAAITANGGTLQMVATVLPATASQDVSWSVVNGTGTATISANGLLTAQSNGAVWAKAVSVQDATKYDSLLVTISNQAVIVASVAVTTQNNVPAAITANGGTLQMSATVLPVTASQDVSWSVINGTGSATISANGLLTAQSNGTVWAKAVSVQDAAKYDSLLVTISNQNKTGINNFARDIGLEVYPNPAQSSVVIKLARMAQGMSVYVIDMSGKVMIAEPISQAQMALNMEQLAAGTYLLQVAGPEGKTGIKLVKQ